MLSSPTVTAVIPAYNAERCIAGAIESALAQTHAMAEIIVVDDGSSDRTAEIAASFPATRVIKRTNGGPGAARNTGIREASSEWIALLDSDDAWKPRKTEIQLQSSAPGVGVIHCNPFDPIYFGNLWHRQAYVTPSGALVRRQALLDAGGFEESRAVMGVEDLNMWLKIALTDWRFVRSDPSLMEYKPTELSLSANDLKMARADLANIQMCGSKVNCQPLEIERIKEASRVEYTRNLIANRRWRDAAELLQELKSGYASRWLSLACSLRISRLARTNLVRRLQSMDAQYASHVCSGECTLSEARRKPCMESCHTPYFRVQTPPD